MGNPLGGYSNINPVLGQAQQKQMLQALVNPMLSNGQLNINPNLPGFSQMQQQYGNIQGLQNQLGMANPVQGLQGYASGQGAGPLASYSNPGGVNPLQAFAGGGGVLSSTPAPNPYQSMMQAPPVSNPYTPMQPLSTAPQQATTSVAQPPALPPAPTTYNINVPQQQSQQAAPPKPYVPTGVTPVNSSTENWLWGGPSSYTQSFH